MTPARARPREAKLERDRFELTAGALCLDFANTVYARPTTVPRDYLPDHGTLLKWAGQARVVTPREARQLHAAAIGQPRAAREVFERAIVLREAIYTLFSALALGRDPSPDAFLVIEAEFGAHGRRWRLERGPQARTWTWRVAKLGLDVSLWPVARSAVALLLSPGVQDLRECAAADCAWLFLDTSRTRRRWCDMRTCGNREKFRRFSARRRRVAAGGG